jgi:hypothetical protein
VQHEHEPQESGLSPAQRELELALRSLALPAPRGVDPIAAAFEAGRRSSQRQVRVWRSALAAVLVAGVGMWFVMSDRGGPGVKPPSIPHGSVAVRSQTAPSDRPPAEQSLIMLQQTIRDKGVDSLPATYVPSVRDLRTTNVM